jgi:hypothetical protein
MNVNLQRGLEAVNAAVMMDTSQLYPDAKSKYIEAIRLFRLAQTGSISNTLIVVNSIIHTFACGCVV